MKLTNSIFLSIVCVSVVCFGLADSQRWFRPRNNWFRIRPRDASGHRTGLGTLGRSIFNSPRNTFRATKAFSSNYNKMRAANIRGGNLRAHENANYEATKIMGNPRLAAGLSAAREQYKNFRFTTRYSSSPSRKGYGDMRTPQEVRNTMAANKRGRDRAMAEMKNQ